MIEIKLSNSHLTAKIDDQNYSIIIGYNWCLNKMGFNNYAETRILNKIMAMHQLILEPKINYEIDHIDGNGLNNQRVNLRYATHSQNNINKSIQLNNTSGYKGVFWHNKANKWMAQVKFNNRSKYIGLYSTKEEAALAYNKKVKELFGEYAYLNIIKN